MDHRPAPVRLTGRAWNPAVVQAPTDPSQRQTLVPNPDEDLAHDPGGLLIDLVAGVSPTSLTGDVAVAEGCTGQDTDGTSLGTVALAAPAALQHFRPLVLGEHALQLRQQAVLGRGPDWVIEEDDLGAGVSKLLDQQNLMRVVVFNEPQIIPDAAAILLCSCGQFRQLALAYPRSRPPAGARWHRAGSDAGINGVGLDLGMRNHAHLHSIGDDDSLDVWADHGRTAAALSAAPRPKYC